MPFQPQRSSITVLNGAARSVFDNSRIDRLKIICLHLATPSWNGLRTHFVGSIIENPVPRLVAFEKQVDRNDEKIMEKKAKSSARCSVLSCKNVTGHITMRR